MTPRLFTAEKNIKAEELKEFLPVNVTTDFKTIATSLFQCEEKYIVPLLGIRLFNKLVDYYASGSPDPTNKKYHSLLQFTQLATVRLAYWEDYDILAVSLSDLGASAKVEAEKRLYRYQEENLKDALKSQGYNQLDIILSHLDNNIDDFQEFKDSKNYTELRNSFVPDTATFNDIFNINNSRLIFLRMKYFIKDVEFINLRHWLGDRFVLDILTNQTRESYERIIPFIRKYVVYESLDQGITELHKLPTEKGLIFETESPTYDSNISTGIINSGELEKTRKLYSQKAEAYMASAIDIIKKHKDDYPLFIDFAGENSPTDQVFRRDNDNKKTFWV